MDDYLCIYDFVNLIPSVDPEHRPYEHQSVEFSAKNDIEACEEVRKILNRARRTNLSVGEGQVYRRIDRVS
jgi:hypothetical protein